MKNEYISIKEFAIRAGVTHQSIYKRLNKDLQPFAQLVAGQRTISTKALSLFDLQPVAQPMQPVAQPDEDRLLTNLTKTIDLLGEQLIVKDKQITELNERIKEYSERLKEANALNNNNQVLLLGKQEPQQIEETNSEKKSFWSRFKGKH